MFFSPCMEIEAYFLLAGTKGGMAIISIALLYLIISVSGMVLLDKIAYKGIIKLNWHKLEHNAGIITGLTLIITGIIYIFYSLIIIYMKQYKAKADITKKDECCGMITVKRK